MNIKLVKLTHEHKEQLFDMLEEWKSDIEKNHTNHSPWMIFKNDYHDFEYYLENLEIKVETSDGRVPDTTLFCLDIDRNIFVGAVNIRHYLNEGLLKSGGHIGDGIRPSERKKGYATAMIALALEECKKLGIEKVLMCCNKNNIGSAKSIIRNGGILENEIIEDGEIEQRYWIDLIKIKQEIKIEEIPLEKINEFWDNHIKYLVEDEIISDDEDIEYFKSDDYRKVLEQHMLRNPDKQHMVYFTLNNERIGAASYCIFQSEDGKCFILDYWVFPKYRGNNTGHNCFEALEKITKMDGAKYYQINCEKPRAIKFWKSIGFVEDGKDEYDMLLMTKK